MRPSSWTVILFVAAVAVPLVARAAKTRHNHRPPPPPRAPQWLRPDKMTREVYAEPVNSAVKLRCQVDGNPTPAISWFKDGVPVAAVARPAHQPPYRPRGDQLRIAGLTHSDAGNFTCVADNEYGSIRKTFRVEVLGYLVHKPVLVESSPNQTVMAGMPAEFRCKFQTDLAMSTLWLRPTAGMMGYEDSFDRSDRDSYYIVKDGRGEPINSDTLRIPSTTLNDSGMYFCAGQTNSGMTPGFLHLTVLSREEAIEAPPTNVTVPPGAAAVLSCRTHLALHGHMSWVRIYPETGRVEELANSTEVYRIANATEKDAGMYACIVGTGEEHVKSVAHLSVEEGAEYIATSVASTLDKSNTRRLGIVAVSVSLVAAVLLVLCLYIFVKCRQERYKKRQAIKSAETITQWTKRVVIERQRAHFDPDAPIVAPVIRIERQSSMEIGNKAAGNNDHKAVDRNVSARSRFSSENTTTTMTGLSEYELPLDPAWEFPRDDLMIGPALGEGAFGKVMQAAASDIVNSRENTTVAVKMLKEGHTDQEMIDLVSEMDIMKMIATASRGGIAAPNVINLLGVCTQDGPLYVIVEYAEHGNLRDFLRRFHASQAQLSFDGYEVPNSATPTACLRYLLSFARQVAKGMEFLAAKKCIHRDLAARNVLVAKDYVAKIADFGLARDVHAHDYYRKESNGPIPVKWMAPETLFQRRYTTQSDVWSFGVLLWEIMTLGANPYPSVPVERLFQLLREGHRMECPQECPPEVYQIMRDCWDENPMRRPNFTKLIQDVDKTMLGCQDYIDMTALSTASLSTLTSPTREQPGPPEIRCTNADNGGLDSTPVIKGLDYASTIIDTSYSANAPLSAASSSQIMPLPPDLEPTPHYEANNSANDEDDDAYMQYSRTQYHPPTFCEGEWKQLDEYKL